MSGVPIRKRMFDGIGFDRHERDLMCYLLGVGKKPRRSELELLLDLQGRMSWRDKKIYCTRINSTIV